MGPNGILKLIHEKNPITSEERGGLELAAFVRVLFKLFTLKYSNKTVKTSSCEIPKLLSEPCFYYLNTIIICKHGINIGLQHNSHIVLYSTLKQRSSPLAEKNVKNWLSNHKSFQIKRQFPSI
jgi:hypothetical protein